jgi:integrase
VHTVAATMSAVLNAAVEDGRIPRNPAKGAHLPEVVEVRVVPLEPAQIHALAAAVPRAFYAAVIVAAGCGLRQGELFGLRKGDVDFLRRELHVRQQLISPSKGTPVLAPLKAKNSVMTIGLSDVVLEALSAHLAAFGTGPEGVIFHLGGRYVSRSAGAKAIAKAGCQIGLSSVGWHALRHAFATLLLSAVTNPAAVADAMGHGLPILLKTYSHYLRSNQDRMRQVVDAAFAAPVQRGEAAS